jgi:mono/diheme cytochrome c family protein
MSARVLCRAAVAGLTLGYLASAIILAESQQRDSPPQAPPDRSYSEAQAKGGKELFAENCASCHGEDLSGAGLAPALAGTTFLGLWEGRSLADLYERLRTTMPADAPGSLSNENYIDVVAFLLQANEVPSGEQDLKTNAAELKRMVFNPGDHFS